MDPLRILTAECGFFTTAEARSAGYADKDLTRMVRAGQWIRFRRGFYAFADEWASWDDLARHLVRCRAVLRSLGDTVALSHGSGVIAHGIDSWGLDLRRVHVTRLDGAQGRIEGDVVHHEGLAVEDDVMATEFGQVMRPERCVLEAASRLPNEPALCVLDAGLRSKLFDEQTLRARHTQMQSWPYMQHLQIVVRMADGRSGSVGESRGRWWFRVLGFPAPELQWEVKDADGRLLGICDWAWPEFKTFGEFDGAFKFGRLLKPGQQPGDVVFEEKKREDAIREATQFVVVRFIWVDYDRPRLMARRLERWVPRFRHSAS
ncbi:type IV toxin-antitoxin system AbiEi family antitoxin domain-containing protein [Nocardioides albidus]|uniref:Type IV toxin-antitoxin system AbiEi family antitoxin domain-containing protein n=1 Tax=Nocardioides albidus TaxID=1517589 RepID=A0A5C4VXA7_9ACTN|nr:type IV toxin-antitoxin system AbiEi family antitoxin domain-containing protein [Nocardioides albidus]TNM40527.1 type IV toxin-antitoxin system AbiEi family antitoxin domain-containing protein [Nocardioides albidus]